MFGPETGEETRGVGRGLCVFVLVRTKDSVKGSVGPTGSVSKSKTESYYWKVSLTNVICPKIVLWNFLLFLWWDINIHVVIIYRGLRWFGVRNVLYEVTIYRCRKGARKSWREFSSLRVPRIGSRKCFHAPIGTFGRRPLEVNSDLHNFRLSRSRVCRDSFSHRYVYSVNGFNLLTRSFPLSLLMLLVFAKPRNRTKGLFSQDHFSRQSVVTMTSPHLNQSNRPRVTWSHLEDSSRGIEGPSPQCKRSTPGV